MLGDGGCKTALTNTLRAWSCNVRNSNSFMASEAACCALATTNSVTENPRRAAARAISLFCSGVTRASRRASFRDRRTMAVACRMASSRTKCTANRLMSQLKCTANRRTYGKVRGQSIPPMFNVNAWPAFVFRNRYHLPEEKCARRMKSRRENTPIRPSQAPEVPERNTHQEKIWENSARYERDAHFFDCLDLGVMAHGPNVAASRARMRLYVKHS